MQIKFIFTLLFSSIITLSVFATDGSNSSDKELSASLSEKITSTLNLDQKQAQLVNNLNTEAIDKLSAALNSQLNSADDVEAARNTILTAQNKVKDALTPEQAEQFENLLTEATARKITAQLSQQFSLTPEQETKLVELNIASAAKLNDLLELSNRQDRRKAADNLLKSHNHQMRSILSKEQVNKLDAEKAETCAHMLTTYMQDRFEIKAEQTDKVYTANFAAAKKLAALKGQNLKGQQARQEFVKVIASHESDMKTILEEKQYENYLEEKQSMARKFLQ